MRITISKGHAGSKIAAVATLKTDDGLRIRGIKIFESEQGQIQIYPPSMKKANGKFVNLASLSQAHKEAVIDAYEKWKRIHKKPPSAPPLTSPIKLNVLYHFMRHHKDKLTEFRMWFVARHILDKNGEGKVSVAEMAKSCGIDKAYAKKLCTHSLLFRSAGSDMAYYRSQKIVIKNHRLNRFVGKIRRDKIIRRFLTQFKRKQSFEGYISKCYMESDLDPKYGKRITRGRISYEIMADFFKITRRTAISCMIHSTAKPSRNIREFPQYVFEEKEELKNWLLRHMDTVLDGHRISENPLSYFAKRRKDGRYVLAQSLPNIYRFTGFSLVDARAIRGKSK